MGRIQDAVVVSARAVRSVPLPASLYTGSLREMRKAYPPSDVQKRHAIDVEVINRTRTVWLDRHLADRGVIVHIPGGFYLSGPLRGDWKWASEQADAQQCAAVVIDYRHAPDYQHPTALDDVVAVIEELARREVLSASSWVLSGLDAGGGLALAAAQADLPVAPAGLILMSPWLDLSLSTTTLSETAGVSDPVHTRRTLQVAADAYAGRTDLEDPRLSPLNGSMEGLPPLHLSVGVKDILRTDVRVAKLQLEEAGIDVSYREITGHLHLLTGLPRSGDAQRLYGEQREFVRRVIQTR